MKKIITILLSLAIFTTTAFADSNFTDVNNNTYYKSAIDWMADNEVINGYPDGSFKPDTCVNRVEFLKMLFRTLDISTETDETELFSDTPGRSMVYDIRSCSSRTWNHKWISGRNIQAGAMRK